MGALFHRDIEEKILEFIDRDEIIIIRGPRQAGKTTLMKVLSGRIGSKKEFVDFDLASNRNAIEESPIDYVGRLLGEEERLALFMDEVQRLDNAGEIMKIIYDAFKGRVKIFASGSSSLEIRNKVLGFLVGRAVLFELLTMNFGEFVMARDDSLYRVFEDLHASLLNFINGAGKAVKRPALSEEFIKLWKEYAIYGGYPEVVKAGKKQVKEALLSNLMNLYIEKDVVAFFRIENTREFENFVKVLAFNDSQMLVLSNVADGISASAYTAKSYLNVLENSYIVSRAYPYYKNASTAIRKTPKLYFLDLGLRNAVLKNLLPYDNRDDNGKLAENFVFLELLGMGRDIKYWRTKAGAEMDFVLDIDGRPFPIEVKLGGSKALGRSFYSFIETYKPKRALVVTLNEFSERRIGGTDVLMVPIFYL